MINLLPLFTQTESPAHIWIISKALLKLKHALKKHDVQMCRPCNKNGNATGFNPAWAIWTISKALLKLKHAWKSLHNTRLLSMSI